MAGISMIVYGLLVFNEGGKYGWTMTRNNRTIRMKYFKNGELLYLNESGDGFIPVPR